MIDNAALKTRRKKLWLPVGGANGYSIDLLVAGGAAAASTDAISNKTNVASKEAATDANLLGGTSATDKNIRLRALGNGTPRIAPISTLNMSGLLVTTAADGLEFCGLIPYDLNRNFTIGLTVFWTSLAAAVVDRTITWLAKYTRLSTGGVLIQPATALGTIITAAQAPAGVSKTLEKSSRGVIAAKTFAAANVFWGFQVTMSAFDASFTENKYLLGLQVDYVPHRLNGRPARQDPLQDSTHLNA